MTVKDAIKEVAKLRNIKKMKYMLHIIKRTSNSSFQLNKILKSFT